LDTLDAPIGRIPSSPALLSPEVIVAKKSFEVKLSKIAADIESASKKMKGFRKHLSKKDQASLDLKVRYLKQAKRLVSQGCHGGRTMTAKFNGPTA
jgi:hypothetical protein